MNEENMLIWSCDKIKFLKIVSQVNESPYIERLLDILNCEWYLKIYSGPENDAVEKGLDYENFFTQWDLYLQKKKSQTSKFLRVHFTLVSGAKVVVKDTLMFGNEEETLFMHDLVFKSRNYDLNLSLIFEDNQRSGVIKISELSNLSEDMRSLLDKDLMTDVVLECDSAVLRAHKNILCARSSVFAAMFTKSLQENSENKVVVKGVDATVFRSMIEFLYSGEIKVDSIPMVCQLVHAADSYDIRALKEGCLDYLKTAISTQYALSVEDVLKLLEISDLFDTELKSEVLSFIKNHKETVKETEAFTNLKLKNPNLVVEINSLAD